MLAAEAAFEALKRNDASEAVLSKYKTALDASWVREEMEPAKNFHAGFHNGLIPGLLDAGLKMVFGPGKEIVSFQADYAHMGKIATVHGSNGYPARDDLVYDGTYLIDKLTDVYHSGTKHDEHQPAHLHVLQPDVCATTCATEFGNPC